MPQDFNQQIIEEFRANAGRVGGPFDDARLLLLTTTGARTGARHTTPVGYLPDGAGRVLVIASAAGSPRHPDWFHNLRAHPRATVEDGVFTYEAQATVVRGAERDELFARAAEADPGWGEYQARTDRVIPVVALEEVPGPPNPNAATWGEALQRIHGAFRRELALIRGEAAACAAAGRPVLGAQLRVNCLTLCQGLRVHHTGEDSRMFPGLAEANPELAPVVDRLTGQHEKLAALLDELQQLLSSGRPSAGRLVGEVDRLVTELEAHLDDEEEMLLPYLQAPIRP
ncbi:nitroreductase/quinone reductase family protein [Streptomyces boncukensis]|uniref:Nitroreductase family deazaflavin-dependent oxidoreductase n=1 Tax=Streptomyces boncukensis TaxID=2711219 RepID=A0A6G4WUM0_9ACTN|nr:nitroreductase/quinone reductase family protein [Streptomyces boncukensis]NGO68976.1 nitroreductase family deazaflavin-dependent oxidoreductase [Streptomyces boncukensis]